MWSWAFILINIAMSQAIYFTMTDIQVQIPVDRMKLPSGNHIVATLYAAQEKVVLSGKQTPYLLYSINASETYLQIVSITGEISFTNQLSETKIKDVGTYIVADVSVEDSDEQKDKTTFKVNIYPMERLDCYFIIEDLCYWQSVNYRIYENSEPTLIGSLNSPYLAELCQDFTLNYTLTTGQDQIELVTAGDINKSWSIRSITPIDREVMRSTYPEAVSGETVNFTVKCTVEDPQHTSREIYKEISIRVLDVDDNPPVAQEEVLNIGIKSDLVYEGQTVKSQNFIFKDRDSPSVNHYDIQIVGDILNILQPNCSTYEDDRQAEPQTVIYCKLIFTKNMQIPNSTYSVALQINDTTLLSGYGENPVLLPVHIHPYGYNKNQPEVLKNEPLILYPSRIVKILKNAAPFARVTQPKKECMQDARSFSFKQDSEHNGAFNITYSEGIVYVQNVELLRKLRPYVSLVINWIRNNTLEHDEIELRLVNEATETCKSVKDFYSWSHCSKYKSPKECTKACALSTGGAATLITRDQMGTNHRCMWRGERNPGPKPTHMYSTCTPDKATCPDGICDPLEELHYLICPQDCTRRVDFPTNKNHITQRGIDIASGVCICDDTGQCRCEHVKEIKKMGKLNEALNKNKGLFKDNGTVQPNVSRHTGAELAKCGTTCMLGIGAAALFLIGAVSMVVVCWRLDRVRGKFSEDPPDMSAPLSDYVDRGVVPDTIHLNFDMTSTLTNNMNKLPDPKWEFPRSQLIIEQTLGEGEFGRVLRARALDIGGQSGYMTVAVKTLKDDAREAELADLLSEYELLKEVSHPNIIRLLGASTVPGGPVYLIIEFAQYGSLRSYLRRSRHLKSECIQMPSSGRLAEVFPRDDHYDEPHVYKVTPKEIISFAWQISNGMSYLSEIKLVHRDLAARNVLLATGKICKISDFGLTRDIYEDDAYFKRSKGRVPVKWMAPESLSDHIYTTQSDVWSFGILVWELMTLGATPYPGIAVQNLFSLLRSGYRMERPENCSPALYKIMRSCWNLQPEQRPTFHQLSRQWEKMLSDEVEYLDLTNNAIHNRSYFCSTTEDNEEEESTINKVQPNSVNYLTKSQSYLKCGESTKISEDNESQSTATTTVDYSNTQGYETPVKIPIVKTPNNENPQYYTDMAGFKAK